MPRVDFEAFVNQRRSPPPAFVYKYTTVDTARAILSTGKLRFQSPLRYNDPFDVQWDPFWSLRSKQGLAAYREVLREAISDPASWPREISSEAAEHLGGERRLLSDHTPEQFELFLDRLVESLDASQAATAMARRNLDDLRRRMRLLCVSAVSDSVLMWSHYADQHRGVVLVFSSERLEAGLRVPLQPVQYCDLLPRVYDDRKFYREMVYGLEGDSGLMRDLTWALAKHSGWKYEAEWRMTTVADQGTLGDYGDYAFPHDALVAIKAGCRAKSHEARELLILARAFSRQIELYQMRMHESKFSVEVDSHAERY